MPMEKEVEPINRLEKAIGGKKRITLRELVRNFHALEFGEHEGEVRSRSGGSGDPNMGGPVIRYIDSQGRGTELAMYAGIPELDKFGEETMKAIRKSIEEGKPLPNMNIEDVEFDTALLADKLHNVMHAKDLNADE